jgi:hypothetical protein
MRLASSGTFFTLSYDFHKGVGAHSFRFSPEETIANSSTWRRPVRLIPVESTVVGDIAWRAWAARMATVLTTCELSESISGIHTLGGNWLRTVKSQSFARPAVGRCSGPLISA